MQYRRAMAVERALGIAGGAGGVAERGRGPLVELRPYEIWLLGRDQVLVARELGEAGRRLGALLGHQHDAAVLRKLRRQPLDQGDEAGIDEEKPVAGVVDDIDDLVIEQPGIDRMADRADTGDRVIELEVAESIPGKRPDPVARFDPEQRQCPGQLFGATLGLRVSITMNAA